MHIGFFDSGVGGITVLYEAMKLLPKEDYIYYADVMNVPYGNKSRDEVRTHIFEAVDFIIDKGVKALVIACNTATSAAIEDLRKKYCIPIIGMEPAVKPAVKMNENNHKRVLVTATAFTLKEEKLKNLISKLDNERVVDLLPLPGLVEFAEKQEFTSAVVENYLVKELEKFDLTQYGTIVLGCTHFPFFKDGFRKILPPGVEIIDGNMGTVKNLKRILKENNLLNDGSGQVVFYNSGKEADGYQVERLNRFFKRLKDIENKGLNA